MSDYFLPLTVTALILIFMTVLMLLEHRRLHAGIISRGIFALRAIIALSMIVASFGVSMGTYMLFKYNLLIVSFWLMGLAGLCTVIIMGIIDFYALKRLFRDRIRKHELMVDSGEDDDRDA